MSTKRNIQSDTEDSVTLTRFIIVHGDKGGVGKSMTAGVLADALLVANKNVAVIDADTRNPDVVRMFNDSPCPKICLNLRVSDGWMDVIDFVSAHANSTFILSMPAGIGESMQKEFGDFVRFLRTMGQKAVGGHRVELHLWWVMNLFPDSVNLLSTTLNTHQGDFDKIVVVRNNIFGQPEDFIFWNESNLKTTVESAGGLTVDLPPLHLRVLKKLFDPTKIVPFSVALRPEIAAALEFMPSEVSKLDSWFNEHVPKGFGTALTELKA